MGQNAFLRQKSKNLQKMVDFDHFFFFLSGGQVGGRASDWEGGKCLPCPPPLIPPLP